MARPLSPSHPNYPNGHHAPQYGYEGHGGYGMPMGGPHPGEMAALLEENAQLRQLCADLENALAEATQDRADTEALEARYRELESLLDSKDETIRALHGELQEAKAQAAEAVQAPARRSGPAPREDELLSLSEELERERRQLQEDEQALMEQMRQMEMSMARERAEMARQRNDLQRLSGEIRHELERLERNGAIQSKMEELKAKLQDTTSRRGAAPSPSAGQKPPPAQAQPEQEKPRGSFLGRLFGG